MLNARLALFSVMLCLSAHGQNWNLSSTAPSNVWYSMAGSQSGSNLVAAILSDDAVNFLTPGQIYASTNAGQTWQLTSAPDKFWISVAASTNGMRLVAAAEEDSDFNPDQIFVSTNSGLNWFASGATNQYWLSVASSADGRILAGATYLDGIYVSTNFGTNWIKSDAPDNTWDGLAMSADGLKMYAATPDGIYVSTNTGSTWNLSATSPPLCYSLVCSADGSHVFTGLEGGNTTTNLGIFSSTNGGATWQQTSAPINDTQNYKCLSMSTYGDILLAGVISSVDMNGHNVNNGRVYLSTDGGATWNSQTAPTNSWGCVFCSADGTLLTAGEYGGYIYAANNPLTNPKLTIKATAQNSIVSWPVFPAGFQLQVNSTLNSPANWTNAVSNIVQLGTNYYRTNSLASPSAFFRLARP